MVTQLGEVVDELDGGRDGTSGDGILGDLVPFVVASSRDQGAACDASNQCIFLQEYRKRERLIILSRLTENKDLRQLQIRI